MTMTTTRAPLARAPLSSAPARRRPRRVFARRVSAAASASWTRDADVVAWAREAWASALERDDDVIDATLGRGRDALACATTMCDGVVFGFDVEPDAIADATAAFARAGVDASRQHFEERCHADALEELARTRPRSFGAVMFNLGYLPGDADAEVRASRRRTEASTTVRAVAAGCSCARVGGVVTVVAYVKHEGGAEEHACVREVLGALPVKSWTVVERRVVNRNGAPVLYVARRVAE